MSSYIMYVDESGDCIKYPPEQHCKIFYDNKGNKQFGNPHYLLCGLIFPHKDWDSSIRRLCKIINNDFFRTQYATFNCPELKAATFFYNNFDTALSLYSYLLIEIEKQIPFSIVYLDVNKHFECVENTDIYKQSWFTLFTQYNQFLNYKNATGTIVIDSQKEIILTSSVAKFKRDFARYQKSCHIVQDIHAVDSIGNYFIQLADFIAYLLYFKNYSPQQYLDEQKQQLFSLFLKIEHHIFSIDTTEVTKIR